jgi:hypothetical protein
VAGGGFYGTEILATAIQAGARCFLTQNLQEFERLGPPEIEIVGSGGRYLSFVGSAGGRRREG